MASWGKLAMIVAAVGAPVVGGGGGVVLRCMLQHNDAGDGFFRALNYPSPMPRRAGLACSGPLECRDAQRRCPFASPRRHVEMRRCLDAESHWIRHSVAPKPTCSAESLKPKPGNILAGLDRHAHAHALPSPSALFRTSPNHGMHGLDHQNPPHHAPGGWVWVPGRYHGCTSGRYCKFIVGCDAECLETICQLQMHRHTCRACAQHREP